MTNIRAKTGARKNLKAVPVRNETLLSTNLLIAVDVPHMNPAPIANAAAVAVPAPVARLTCKSLNEIKKLTEEKALELIGIKLTPMRMKCALLGWKTLKKAIA